MLPPTDTGSAIPGIGKWACLVLALAGWARADGEASPSTPVRAENLKPGSTDWQLTRVRVDAKNYRSPWIEGYCSKQSVRAGESIDIMVSTDPPRRSEIEIFRMGYYGGRGARLMAKLGPFDGTAQETPTPGPKNVHECRWEPTTRLTIPADWLGDVYLGRLTTLVDPDAEPYWQRYVIFIVRDDRPADVLFQCSDNTWQAYNRWPNNYSLYTHPKGADGPWAEVSFDRPYSRESQYTGVVNDPLTVGAGEFLPLEFPLAYWLEQNGYDVTYCSNSNMTVPDHGLKCKAFISVGHDEYWDIRQFRSLERMRDAGVNLLFLSATRSAESRRFPRAATAGPTARSSAPARTGGTMPITSRAGSPSTALSPSAGPMRDCCWGRATSTPTTAAPTGSS
jgi:hypothetical protein